MYEPKKGAKGAGEENGKRGTAKRPKAFDAFKRKTAKRPAGAKQRPDMSVQGLARITAAMAAVTVLAVGLAIWTQVDADQRGKVLEQTTVRAVVAQKDIAAGEMIEAEAVSVEQVPRSAVPAGTASAAEDVAGRIALADIPARATVNQKQVSGDEAGTLAGRVGDDKVAVTASVTEETGAAGLVMQGDTVTLLGQGAGGDASATEIATHAKVIACGGQLDGHDPEYTTITVEVSRQEAAAIATAEAAGGVTFVVEPASAGE